MLGKLTTLALAIASIEALRIDSETDSYASRGEEWIDITPGGTKPAGGEGSSANGVSSIVNEASSSAKRVGSVANGLPLGSAKKTTGKYSASQGWKKMEK